MSAIPNFLKLSTIPVDYVQQVETELIESVVNQEATENSTGFARFEIPSKGFLHSHSKLFLSLIPNASNADAFLPQNIGIGSVIERATLKVGNQVLNEISDWSHLHSIKSMFIDNEFNKDREQYSTGRCINHKFMFKNSAGNESEVFSEKYGLDNSREYSGTTSGAGELKQLPFANMDGTDADTRSKSPVYCVDLVHLFPFLDRVELPLYLIQNPVTIELVWSKTATQRVCTSGTVGKPYLIDQNELKLACDFIFYGATDEMARFAAANPKIEFSFEDYRLIKSTTDKASLESGIVTNLGMSNRMVSRVLTKLTESGTGDDTILGPYVGEAPAQNASSEVGSIEYNIRYNDRFEYATNISNPARLFNQLVASEGIPFVSRQEYSNQQQGITSATFEGRAQGGATNGGLVGNFFVMGTRLTGKRIGQQGIELHLKVNSMRDLPYTVRSYCEYLRTATLNNGLFEVYNL